VIEARENLLVFENVSTQVDWIRGRLLDVVASSAIQVGNFVPRGYEKYVCVQHPLHDGTNQRIPGSIEQLALKPFMTIMSNWRGSEGEDAYFAFWRGMGRLDNELQRFTSLRTWSSDVEKTATFSFDSHRSYLLLRGSTEAMLTTRESFSDTLSPQLWWATNKAWFIFSDIDFEFSILGCDNALANMVLSSEDLVSTEVTVFRSLSGADGGLF
jgi:hypothetical protein